jgi:hypothetical protein
VDETATAVRAAFVELAADGHTFHATSDASGRFDFSLIKDTPLGRRPNGSELTVLQFRSEFFNIFNIVDMGLPANTIAGSGFGVISRTAGNSRQIQFSLKLLLLNTPAEKRFIGGRCRFPCRS